MSNLFVAALSPALACLFYIYIRDKYEKEPVRLLVTGTVFGIFITFPIIQAENMVTALLPICGKLAEAFYISFFVAGFVEEAFKFVVLYFLTWRDKNLNEPMDGIVYSVFISLGFAGLENILYVFNPELGGMSTALLRAVFSVPSHGFFGITMGYYFAMAKFEPHNRTKNLAKAFFVTWFIHGVFDFILLADLKYYMLLFLPFVAYMWLNGFRKIKSHLEKSPFKAQNHAKKI